MSQNILIKDGPRRIYRPKDPGYGRVLPHRLSDARSHAGLDQAELARRIGIPASSISHFEAGRRKPNLNSLYKLAEALDVSTDYLLGRTSDRAAHLDPGAFSPAGRHGQERAGDHAGNRQGALKTGAQKVIGHAPPTGQSGSATRLLVQHAGNGPNVELASFESAALSDGRKCGGGPSQSCQSKG